MNSQNETQNETMPTTAQEPHQMTDQERLERIQALRPDWREALQDLIDAMVKANPRASAKKVEPASHPEPKLETPPAEPSGLEEWKKEAHEHWLFTCALEIMVTLVRENVVTVNPDDAESANDFWLGAKVIAHKWDQLAYK